MARGPAKRELGHGSRVSGLVVRYQPHRHGPRLRGAASCAFVARPRRIGCLSILFKDSGQTRCGIGARLREFGDRIRAGVRAGVRHVAGWPADGAVRLALFFHQCWINQHPLACPLAPMDAARRGNQSNCLWRELADDLGSSETSGGLGLLCRPLLYGLFAIPDACMAAILFAARASLFDGIDGENRWGCVPLASVVLSSVGASCRYVESGWRFCDEGS